MIKIKRIPLPDSEEPIISHAHFIRKSPPHKKIEITLHLRSKPSGRELPSLDHYSETPLYQRKHISHEEFEKLHGADPADVEKVKGFAKNNNLSIKEIHMAKRHIHLVGPVKTMNEVFGINLLEYQHKKKDKSFRAHEGLIHIPEELKDIVVSVSGLSTPPIICKPWLQGSGGSLSRGGTPYPGPQCPYLTPPQLAKLYNFPGGVTGKGQTIGIIELGGGYERKYLQEYFESIGVPMPTITSVGVDSGKNNPGVNVVYDGEVCLDIEVAAAVAPGAHIVVYFAPGADHQSLYRTLKYAVHDKEHRNTVISLSWGDQEEDYSKKSRFQINQVLQEAALLGITVCTSASDFGSSDTFNLIKPDHLAHVDFPAASPWALACGGTTLKPNANKTAIESEVVWNDGVLFATGGGVSTFYSCPPYQKKAGIHPKSVNPAANTGRGIPDVAANASMENGYITKVNHYPLCNGGGTSAVAPLWAALIALLNEKLNTRLGFINPALYQIKKAEDAFNHITKGNNQNVWWVPGYSAGPGWNACTGLGSPNGEKLLAALQKQLTK